VVFGGFGDVQSVFSRTSAQQRSAEHEVLFHGISRSHGTDRSQENRIYTYVDVDVYMLQDLITWPRDADEVDMCCDSR
jgi:hypothetical protein